MAVEWFWGERGNGVVGFASPNEAKRVGPVEAWARYYIPGPSEPAVWRWLLTVGGRVIDEGQILVGAASDGERFAQVSVEKAFDRYLSSLTPWWMWNRDDGALLGLDKSFPKVTGLVSKSGNIKPTYLWSLSLDKERVKWGSTDTREKAQAAVEKCWEETKAARFRAKEDVVSDSGWKWEATPGPGGYHRGTRGAARAAVASMVTKDGRLFVKWFASVGGEHQHGEAPSVEDAKAEAQDWVSREELSQWVRRAGENVAQPADVRPDIAAHMEERRAAGWARPKITENKLEEAARLLAKASSCVRDEGISATSFVEEAIRLINSDALDCARRGSIREAEDAERYYVLAESLRYAAVYARYEAWNTARKHWEKAGVQLKSAAPKSFE